MIEPKKEYELIIRFLSDTPFYEIRSYMINSLLNEFQNLTMWDLKRVQESLIEKQKNRIAELERENEKLKVHFPQWHDLRKNPDDLPRENTLVFSDKGMAVMWRDFSWVEYSPNYDNIKLRNWEKPVAWCELPKFED